MDPQFQFKFSLFRFGVLLVIWWILTEGNQTSLWFGVLFSALGSSIERTSQTPKLKLSLVQLITFLPLFILSSLTSAWGVIQIILKPKMPLSPGLVHYKLKLPEGPARVILANLLTLLPGTLSVNLDSDEVILHVLNLNSPVYQEVQSWEIKIARLLSLKLISAPEG